MIKLSIVDFLKKFINFRDKQKQFTLDQKGINESARFSQLWRLCVCVCMFANIVIDLHVRNSDKFSVIYPNGIYCFRYYIAYKLYANSIHCHSHINVVAKGVFDRYIIGLTNIGNTCWFNATAQIIAAMLIYESKCFDLELNCGSMNQSVVDIFRNLLSYQGVNHDASRDAMIAVCTKCHFEYGLQQDPKEFFTLSQFLDFLDANVMAYGVSYKSYKCETCAFSETIISNRNDMIFIVSQESYENMSINHHLKAFLKQTEILFCKKCPTENQLDV